MGYRVSEIWAWIGQNRTREGDDEEGICAALEEGFPFPIVMATCKRENAEKLRSLAQRIGYEQGRRLKLVRFTSMEVVDEVGPK